MKQLPPEIIKHCLQCHHLKSDKAGHLYCNARTCPKKKVRDKIEELKGE